MLDSFKIALVGEAYGEEEARYGKPFIGKAGEQLNSLLEDAGIDRSACFITNVFNLRPDGNDLASLCVPAKDSEALRERPSLIRGGYLKRQYAGELDRLYRELEKVHPNVTVLLGNTPSWAVLQQQAISKIRGTCSISPSIAGLKVLPTYHPAAVLRQYELRHVTVLDLLKAKRESEYPELRRPLRELWIDPTLQDIERFFHEFVLPSHRMAFDIETAIGQVTCIGFAPSVDRAIIIPILDHRHPGASYWSREDEPEVWRWIKAYLESPCEKVGQNTLYDIQYLWRLYGISPRNYAHDTMLLHHSLHPESPKSLGFLGSIYTNEIAWKPNRPRGKHNEKPGDEE